MPPRAVWMVGAVIALLLATVIYDRLSGRRLVRDSFDKLRLAGRSVSAWDAYWAANPCRSDIVVCLTTVPARIDEIDATLKSLLYQHRAPARIRLHVPRTSKREGVPYLVPAWIERLAAVEVVRCDEDFGPATKLIPALRDLEPSQALLVVDDDKLYAPCLVDDMHRASHARPDIAIGSSGWSVPEDLTHQRVTSWLNLRGKPPARLKASVLRSPVRVDILQGYSGYLVRPAFFDVDQLIEGYAGAPPEAFFVDDVWISGHCNAEKWVLPARRFCFVSWRRVRLHDRTSLGERDAHTDPAQHPNTVVIRHLRDRWHAASDSRPERP